MEATAYVDGHSFGECYTEGWKINTPIDKEAYKRYRFALDTQEDLIITNRSKSIALNLAMIDAKDYYNEPNMYFSYQFDFRGRIYPIQQHLNPQGKEEIKALGVGYILKNEPPRVISLCKVIGFNHFMFLRRILFNR